MLKFKNLRPSPDTDWIGDGAAYDKKGDYESPIADYTRAINLNPTLAEAYNGRGVAYRRTGEYNQAVADCAKAIQLNPKYGDAYNNLAVAFRAKRDYENAWKIIKVAQGIGLGDAINPKLLELLKKASTPKK